MGFTIQDIGAASTPSPNAIGAGELIRFGTVGSAENTNQSIYIQDKIQFGGRVTFNAGVRLEKEDLPSFNGLAPPINFGWSDKVAPRLGVAVSLNNSGTAKVWGSFGRFFDRLKFELPRGSFGGDFYRWDYFEIFANSPNWRTFTIPQILGTWNDAPGGNCPTTGFIAPGALSRCQYDYRIASNNPNATIYTGQVDPNLKPFQQDEFTFGYQQEFWGKYVLGSRFTWKDVKWAIEDAGILTPDFSEAYIIGNPGSGLHAQVLRDLGYQKSLKPQRDYRAWEISLDRRLANNFYFNVNYTWSRLYGNYSGLASSDENGRTSPGVNRFFDLPYIGFTYKGEPDNGLLATDRTHVVNSFGAYVYNWLGRNTNSTTFSYFTTFANGAEVFPNARFAMSTADLEFWTAESNLSLPEPLRGLVAGTRAVVNPRRARFTGFAPGAEVAPGIRSVPMPGHTVGHVGYHIESQGQRLLVTGDLANHAVLALARPDWPFSFDSDPALASTTRRRVLEMAATDRVQLLAYHFPWPGLGHVEARGQGFGWVPSPWRWG
ncbi:MBL fold metallo-hydrolase [Leptolyngbya sp. 15MV]|nr:MBL fold metallo-hydrolase [Leptolyngbya sp. 15MV]